MNPLGRFGRAARLVRFGLDLSLAQVRARTPFKLTLITTDRCSCRCAICHLWKAPRDGPTLADIDRLFAANAHLSWINLSGGEVVERDDFTAIVESAVRRTRVAALDFPTAAQRPAELEARVRAALATGVPRLFVTVSIDGPRALHDRLRGTPGAFDRAVDGFARLKSIRDRRLVVAAGLTFSSRNSSAPDRVVDDLLADAPVLRRDDLHFNVAHHAPHYYRNRAEDRPDADQRAALARMLASESDRRESRSPLAFVESLYWRHASRWLVDGKTPVACAALGATAYVDADLRLFPCATWDRPLLDLRSVDFSLRRAVATIAAREAREIARRAACPGCWTPCEAFPTLLTRLPRAIASAPRARVEPAPRGAIAP